MYPFIHPLILSSSLPKSFQSATQLTSLVPTSFSFTYTQTHEAGRVVTTLPTWKDTSTSSLNSIPGIHQDSYQLVAQQLLTICPAKLS